MAGLEAARLLLAKARQDEYVLAQFVGDAAAADETFGFHAQQAAEKLLKRLCWRPACGFRARTGWVTCWISDAIMACHYPANLRSWTG